MTRTRSEDIVCKRSGTASGYLIAALELDGRWSWSRNKVKIISILCEAPVLTARRLEVHPNSHSHSWPRISPRLPTPLPCFNIPRTYARERLIWIFLQIADLLNIVATQSQFHTSASSLHSVHLANRPLHRSPWDNAWAGVGRDDVGRTALPGL